MRCANRRGRASFTVSQVLVALAAVLGAVAHSLRGTGGANSAATGPISNWTSRPSARRGAGSVGRWTVAFIMPSEWTMETLPEPMNDDVTLREQPARRMAVYQFSGMMNDARAQRGREALDAYLQERGLGPLSAPTYASYDPPWIPGPFRRNEVWVEIATS